MATIGARVKEKNDVIRSALAGTSAADNKVVIDALVDGWVAAEESSQTGAARRGGGREEDRRRREENERRLRRAAGEGDAPAPAPAPAAAAAPAKTVQEAIAADARRIIQDAQGAATGVDGAAGRLVLAMPLVLGVGGGGALALNHPTMFGNLVSIIANILASGTDIAIRSTWGDWGNAVLSVGQGIGILGKAVATQTAQGPVVPFAIASAVVAWAASKRKDKSAAGILGDMARFVSETLPGLVPASNPAITLKELAEIARTNRPDGEGARALIDQVRTELLGEPAIESGRVPGAVAVVPRSRGVSDVAAPLRRLAAIAAPPGMSASNVARSQAVAREARGVAGPGSATGEPARPPMGKQTGKRGPEERPKEEEDTGAGTGLKKSRSMGGRRKTRKSKAKRRVTRRLNVVKFVY